MKLSLTSEMSIFNTKIFRHSLLICIKRYCFNGSIQRFHNETSVSKLIKTPFSNKIKVKKNRKQIYLIHSEVYTTGLFMEYYVTIRSKSKNLKWRQ